MSNAQLYFEEVAIGDEVRPMFQYIDRDQCVEWGYVSNNSDVGHWHIWSNRHKGDPADPKAPVQFRGQPPTLHGQFKTALFEKFVLEWAGSGAWVKKLEVSYRIWDHPFEVKTFQGKVTAVAEVDGLPCVTVEAEMFNEAGQRTSPAIITVVLPKRNQR